MGPPTAAFASFFCLMTPPSGTAVTRSMVNREISLYKGLVATDSLTPEMDMPHRVTTPKRAWSSQAKPLKMFFFLFKELEFFKLC
jgi:hypothetical protein